MHDLFLTLKRRKDVRNSFYCAALCWVILFSVSFNFFTGSGTSLELILSVLLAYIATLYLLRMRGEIMNLVDAYVTEIKGVPEFKYGKWFVPVFANSYGVPMETEIMCSTEDEAKAICVGHHFLT